MHLHPAAPLKLFLPFVLMGATFFARDYMDQLSGEARVVVDNLPYLFCVVAVFMANQFNRSRLLLASFGVAIFYWVLRSYLQVSLEDPEAETAYVSISLALPILGLYIFLLPERGVWNLFGMAFTTTFIVLGYICVQMGPWLPQVNEAALSYYAPWPVEGYVMSLGGTLLVALVAAVGFLLLLIRDEWTEVALLGAFLALYLSLALLHLEHISVAMCAAASLCLVLGLLRSSHTMAYLDDLTGLGGRRAMNEKMTMLGTRFTIAMLDIDHFKKFNDTYGHDVGDEVLRLVASRIKRVGAGGTAYRYGGEEFCIIFPRREVEECVEAVSMVRESIAEYKMSIRDKDLRPVKSREGSKKRGATRLGPGQISVTISGGLAQRDADNPDAETVIVAADKQLYRAKKAGRNRIAY
ncbi:MAG: diguanylate cyclase (GGDEF)-like protein [Halioglobus sp.]|jgi:diguanylate cyclase (GGDEF)-like protein